MHHFNSNRRSHGRHPSDLPPAVNGYGVPPPTVNAYGIPVGPAPAFYPPQGQGYGPPPGANPQLWNWFSTVDRNGNGEISARELRQALMNDDWTHFDMETVNMLINMFDEDNSGTIGFNEFVELWDFIADRKRVFRQFDTNDSGTIEASELRNALHNYGYQLPHNIIHLIMYKYATVRATTHPRRNQVLALTFDHFIRVCVTVKHLSQGFRELPRDRDGWVQMDYVTFMGLVLSAP